MNIPIIIICYNNYKYVENTLNQIKKINMDYYNNIHILNNCSTCIDTINFLKNIDVKVINNTVNAGPWINNSINRHIYNILPNKYIITDPDLELNENIPNNFVEVLSGLSDKYKCHQIGFALDISDFNKMYQTTYYPGYNIYEFEIRYWNKKINDDKYELYDAAIDTTFCLINKTHIHSNIRVAGNFTAKHLPWYIDNKIHTVYENYLCNIKTEKKISTISNLILPYFEKKYSKINKNNELFLIENDKINDTIHFWKNSYTEWRKDLFNILDSFLDSNKIFIDIGSWCGQTTMYGSRKSKQVYSIESDINSFNDMSANLHINCKKNYTLINKAVYNVDDDRIRTNKNIFLNDSTYLIETITLQKIIEFNSINPNEIALINVDIEGGEEHILTDLYNMHKKYNTPLYITFRYDWWENKNLDRFIFLTPAQKENLTTNPVSSLLFSNTFQ